MPIAGSHGRAAWFRPALARGVMHRSWSRSAIAVPQRHAARIDMPIWRGGRYRLRAIVRCERSGADLARRADRAASIDGPVLIEEVESG